MGAPGRSSVLWDETRVPRRYSFREIAKLTVQDAVVPAQLTWPRRCSGETRRDFPT